MRLVEVMKSKYKKINKVRSDGFLSRSEIITLRNIKNKPMSSARKRTYKKWLCAECKHEFYYTIRSCLLCESENIAEITQRTQYQLAFMTDDDVINAENSLFDESANKTPKSFASISG